jgi:hypothetical protein
MMYSTFTEHVINFLKKENLIDQNYQLKNLREDYKMGRDFININLATISPLLLL